MGERVGRVSLERFSGQDDERYPSLAELANAVRGLSERSRTRVAEISVAEGPESSRLRLAFFALRC